ncbi:DCN1-like protein 3 [Lepeophtheirus salmonis]|uniref:DCN1-like protein 3 n=1 Tax=Lepeophtheirus salmonis TaxID=72036 RepID=UPI001AE4FD1D|nr:DCN1-like protein 3 [Lepeophtheirus salmonis]XP_040571881.1 DCN1-like protein 3 [Lepeophtheirus salmonis]XP_040571891.1 DCN1-like protein 3 [Lepeophtheirus salmonis]
MMGNILCGEGGGGGRCFCCYEGHKRQRRSSYGGKSKKEVKTFTDLISVSECVNGESPSSGSGASGGVGDEKEEPRQETPLEERRALTPLKIVSESDISALFDIYHDSENLILSEGVQKLCADLELQPEEFRILILAWKCKAERMCRLTRLEFIEGLKSLGADDVASLKRHLTACSVRVNEVQESSSNFSYNASFRDLYRFTYKFGLEPGQRILPTEMATSLWQLVFSQRTSSQSLNIILPKWFHFLKIHPFIRGISKDTWNMFLNFLEIVGSDLSSYDDTEAWPSLLDDFVEFENDKLNQNIVDIKDANNDKYSVSST